MDITNIKIQPMNVILGVDRKQIEKVVFRADTVADPLSGRFFVFQDAAGAKHYAWFDNGDDSVDPAPAGSWSGHAISYTEGDSATALATAAATVIGAVTNFDASATG